MDLNPGNELAVELGNIASAAGKLIMTIRASGVVARRKPDGSPVTAADIASEQHIRERLAAVQPDTPFIAEESFDATRHRAAPGRFWLVDPLDGTREFLAGETDFTVNIALIEAGRPVAGAIYAPALRDVYVAGAAAYRAEIEPGLDLPALDKLTTLRTSAPSPVVRAVVSRSHLDARTEQWIRRLPRWEQRTAGSSLKFCLIARGDADVYPRLAPTMEWDTAAGHAILTAAGGAVLTLDGSPLRYGKLDAGYRNDGFIAWGRAPGG